ncbi:hypothetical protein M877_03100 [Streptomyces niveus NCIMB 11891]|nr:hypothetical protein M877_03100 [Streptomyces niveus NCIMB 11891]
MDQAIARRLTGREPADITARTPGIQQAVAKC